MVIMSAPAAIQGMRGYANHTQATKPHVMPRFETLAFAPDRHPA